jgi:hypothetical protein
MAATAYGWADELAAVDNRTCAFMLLEGKEALRHIVAASGFNNTP